MVVEQIRYTMQRYRRLARTRAAVDDHDAAAFIADDLILLALDGFHDGIHVRGTRAVHRLVQRGFAGDADVIFFYVTCSEFAGEHLIGDISDRAPLGADMAAHSNIFRLRCGGEVKRSRHRRAPI